MKKNEIIKMLEEMNETDELALIVKNGSTGFLPDIAIGEFRIKSIQSDLDMMPKQDLIRFHREKRIFAQENKIK